KDCRNDIKNRVFVQSLAKLNWMLTMIGKTISHYKILEKLGGGGMAVVYKAQDLKLDRHVALKFLPPHLSQDEENKKPFIHEAKAASALDHPNICTIYAMEEGEQPFIAMEFVEGRELRKIVGAENFQPLQMDVENEE
ncbi:MAG: protein kinase, partial [bacterium]